MTTLKLKTNLNCANCVAKVTPHLNSTPGVASWAVDTADPDKVLTVTGDGLTAGAVGDAVAKAGFRVLDVLPASPKSAGEPGDHGTQYPVLGTPKFGATVATEPGQEKKGTY